MRLYGLKTCDTCRKALKVLGNAEFVDVRAEGVPEALLNRAYAEFGGALVNTRSTTWRGLSAAERQEAPISLLQKHPTLMKRPLIEVDGALYLGWGKDVQAALG
ncbi:ArsC/Spx/MgsR family protein [Shimia sp. FJ5]|uniref:ArsC/Spx/MgsR family protein n=1 Tax=Shimia sp. FJ5 TaxID=3079054 RepID=UPI00261A642A|nr:ArsC/Spx/MgsR family protein [Shimia sp. FJ5]MDV4145421.1 ArsC/Spx/MgsR family protein [Shimia sp. FJ5]